MVDNGSVFWMFVPSWKFLLKLKIPHTCWWLVIQLKVSNLNNKIRQAHIKLTKRCFLGVYRLKPDLQVFIDVSAVYDLHSSPMSSTTLKMGGNVSITEAMRVLRKAARQRGFEYCEQLADHMDKVANVGVRNVRLLFVLVIKPGVIQSLRL